MKNPPNRPPRSLPVVSAICLVVSLGFTLSSCEKADSPSAETGEATAEQSTVDGDKPIQHLQVPEVTDAENAENIFLERTDEITGKQKLDNAELHEIHMATYHLEKAVAYFAENLEGARKEAAEEIAVVVEEIHLSSENFEAEEAKKHIEEFEKLAESFSADFN